jgi:CHRD domain
LKPKNNILAILGSVGLAAAILILGAATNGFINSVSGQKQQEFIANLSGSNEMPPVKTSATGTVKFTAGANDKSLAYVLNVTNMNGVMGAHIHSAKQGENGPVVAGLFNPGMIGPPTGKVNGVLAKGNITSSDLQGTLPGKQISDIVNLVKSHGAYVDIHTQKHENGEIRGQIGPIS